MKHKKIPLVSRPAVTAVAAAVLGRTAVAVAAGRQGQAWLVETGSWEIEVSPPCRQSGPVSNSIMLCWLFIIKDCIQKVWGSHMFINGNINKKKIIKNAKVKLKPKLFKFKIY